MFHAIWQLSARRTLTWYLPVFLLLVGYTLFVTHPLGIDPPAAVFGGLLGWLLAFRLFVDPPGVSPLIFSRPFSRTRLFLYRWAIGILLQVFALAVVAAILASGLRQATQLCMFRSTWFPMVRWFELSMLWPTGLASIVVYQASCFFLLRRRLSGNPRVSKPKRLANAAFLAAAMLLAAIVALVYVGSHFMQSSPPITWEFLPSPTTWMCSFWVFYGVLLLVATTLAALYCSRHFEVDA
jgi:hypothetical protein